MGGIFISYRREDAAGHAGRLFDRLKARFGPAAVFMDVEGIDAGVDFVERIDAAVGSCDVLLAVIGRHWLDARNADGARRLDDPRDFVRLETGAALARGIRVIPVLVEGAAMPTQEALPEALRPLARRQAVELRDSRWDADVEHLLRTLEPVLVPASPTKAKPSPRTAWLAGALVLALAGIGLGLWSRGPGQAPGDPHDAPPVSLAPPTSVATQPPAASVQVEAAAPAPTPARPTSRPERQVPAIAAVQAPPAVPAEPAPAAPPAAAIPATAPAAAAPTRATAEKPAGTAPAASPQAKKPKAVIHALGLPGNRAFWNREESPGYSAKMATLFRDRLLEQAGDRFSVVQGSPGETARGLLEGGPPAREQACRDTGASVLWVALARQEFSISQAESAHWPELRLAALPCDGGERREHRVGLAPGRDDAFPFATDMGKAMGAFAREHLHLMR